MENDKDKLKQDMEKLIKRHGKILKEYIEEIGEEAFWKKVDEVTSKDNIEK